MKKLKQIIKDKLGEKKIVFLRKIFRVLNIVKNVVCWMMIVLLTLAVIVFMVTKFRGDTPTVFGYTLHRIVSGSMSPTLEIGDVIIGYQVNDASDIAVGDIITFQGDARFDDRKVTHRVLVAPYRNDDGSYVLVTKGDANEIDDGEIRFSNVDSRFVAKVNFLKDIYNFFFSPWGLIIFIFLLLLIFFDEIMNIAKLIIAGREQEKSESLYEIVERLQREQTVQQDGENNDRILAEKAENHDLVEQKSVKEETSGKAEKDQPSARDGKQPTAKKQPKNKKSKKSSSDKNVKKKKKAQSKKTQSDSVKRTSAAKKKSKKKSKKRRKR